MSVIRIALLLKVKLCLFWGTELFKNRPWGECVALFSSVYLYPSIYETRCSQKQFTLIVRQTSERWGTEKWLWKKKCVDCFSLCMVYIINVSLLVCLKNQSEGGMLIENGSGTLQITSFICLEQYLVLSVGSTLSWEVEESLLVLHVRTNPEKRDE